MNRHNIPYLGISHQRFSISTSPLTLRAGRHPLTSKLSVWVSATPTPPACDVRPPRASPPTRPPIGLFKDPPPPPYHAAPDTPRQAGHTPGPGGPLCVRAGRPGCPPARGSARHTRRVALLLVRQRHCHPRVAPSGLFPGQHRLAHATLALLRAGRLGEPP